MNEEWFRLTQLGVSALTPIISAMIGLLILRLAAKLEHAKHLNHELLRKRLLLLESIVPKLNDIYCFYQGIGHWAELNPNEIIKRKREIDRTFYTNQYLFEQEFWSNYQKFEAIHFDTFSDVGQPAKLRLDVAHLRSRIGDQFKPEWKSCVSPKGGDFKEQGRAYQQLIEILSHEVRATE